MASYIDGNVSPWLLEAFCIHYNRWIETTYSTKQVHEGLSLMCNFRNTDELHTVRQKHFCSHQCQCNTLLALCLSWIWFIKSHCVDKQKQQALLTHTHTHTEHLCDEQQWSWNWLACQQGVWWVTHLAKSSAVPPREVLKGVLFCLLDAPSPQTQQPSWTRPQLLQGRRELFVLQLWTFWLDSVRPRLPLPAPES